MHLSRNVSECVSVIKDRNFKNPEEHPHMDPLDRCHLMSFASSSHSNEGTQPENQTSQIFGPEGQKNIIAYHLTYKFVPMYLRAY